mmetsp:Transcript_4794/g.8564  ORF Transcript_4794/g.8564 Transcript_4794/m.8564 type:complete len:107 (-) Transcript_4794:997-1317(-)
MHQVNQNNMILSNPFQLERKQKWQTCSYKMIQEEKRGSKPLPSSSHISSVDLNNLRCIPLYSVASQIPLGPTANAASASGRVGESYTVQIRFSPRPFRSRKRVVDA